ncbi:MAG: hypothetical protein ABIK92_04350 [Pseudomonadota bacterium]
MECYIIRIYRRDKKNPDIVSGIAEISGVEKPVIFSSMKELENILKNRSEEMCSVGLKSPRKSAGK